MSTSRSSSRASDAPRPVAASRTRVVGRAPSPARPTRRPARERDGARAGACTVQWAGGITARASLIIGAGGEKVIGPRFIRLLRLTAVHGSLRGAARELGMGHRHAVAWVRQAEEMLGRPLVDRRAGGVRGGGATLAAAGAGLIDAYQRVTAEIARIVAGAERDFLA